MKAGNWKKVFPFTIMAMNTINKKKEKTDVDCTVLHQDLYDISEFKFGNKIKNRRCPTTTSTLGILGKIKKLSIKKSGRTW